MFNTIFKHFMQNNFSNKLFYIMAILVLVLLGGNIFFVYKSSFSKDADPVYILSFLLASLVSTLVLCVLIISSRASSIFMLMRRSEHRVSQLRKRIIIAFSIGAALPTIIVAVFSIYFFNFGIEAWFDKKISKVLDQSIHVGESYVAEHVLQIKETAISIADDLSTMYYELIHSPELFSKVLNAQAEMRSIDEAIVFQHDTHAIVAQTTLSFSLSFTTIPKYLIERANRGEIVQISSDSTKIRILIKLRDYNNTYLLIGRVTDAKIIEHINKTNGTAEEYFHLRDKISTIQIKFAIVFILLSLILLLGATIWGQKFAEHIVHPIRELVKAAERVKNGDLSAQVPLARLKKDEIKVLSSAFNRMVSQIERQQKDLLVAQRSLAWSDVARRVAHEIKNPLTPIQLSAEMLLKKFANEVSDKESFVKYSKNILNHSNDIKIIVSEFVEFARLPAPNFSQCEIVSMLNDLIESRKLINGSINYNLISNIAKFNFVCDIAQLNRAIVNLLLNAEESFLDSRDNKKINIKIDIQQNEVKIIVSDNGSGFTDSLLKSAKENYVTTKIGGTGLGLAIVDRIAMDHLGKMKILNNEQGGARIELIFNALELSLMLK